MKPRKEYDLIIIGGGPAGLAAAVEAYERGLRSILIVEREDQLGGILLQCIHNGFGLHEFKEELTGPAFAQRYIDQVHELGIEYMLEASVTLMNPDRSLMIVSKDGFIRYFAKAVILAMGCRERPRGAISIPGSRPAGVLTAGAAQKYLNMDGYLVGEKVFILGSGDIGLIMARRMTLEGAHVVGVAEIQSQPNGLTRNIVQCLHDFHIPLHLSHTVTRIYGKERIEAIELSKVDEQFKPIAGTQQYIEVDALLLSVGLIPNNSLSEGLGIDLSKTTKGPIVSNDLQTSMAGYFACGNVLHVHDVVDYVVAEARRCVDGVMQYLSQQLSEEQPVEVIADSGLHYVVPQYIKPTSLGERQRFYFRVQRPEQKVKVKVHADGALIKESRKAHVIPAEMDYIEIEVNDAIRSAKQIRLELVKEV